VTLIRATSQELSLFSEYINRISGIHLDSGKGYLLETRLVKMLKSTESENFTDLFEKIQADFSRKLEQQLLDAMTTNETHFFRDRAPFDLLQHKIIPDLIDRRVSGADINKSPLTLKIWSSACSTGQEVYSIGIVIKELLGDISNHNISILGTDISNDAVTRASYGHYNWIDIERGLPQDKLNRYFHKVNDEWKIDDEIRSMATFRKMNLMDDFSYLGKFDIIFCRNVAIYFPEDKKKSLFKQISKLSDLKEYINKIELDKFSDDFQERLIAGRKHTDEYEAIRKRVTALTISTADAIGFYTNQNSLFLEVIRYIAVNVPTVEIRTQLNAYNNFLRGKERAGIERAVLSNAFAMDLMGFDNFKTFNNLVVNQEVYFEVFMADANDEQRAFFSNTLSGPVVNEVQRMRDIAFDNVGKESLGDIDPAYWFDQMTMKINLMLDIELKLASDFDTAVAEHRSSAKIGMILFIVLAITLLIVLVIFSIYVIVKVTKPIEKLKQVVGEVAKGDLTATFSGSFSDNSAISNDELGDLMMSFIDMTKNLKDVITSIIKGSTDLTESSSDLLKVSVGLATEASASTAKAGTVAAAAEELNANSASVSEGMHQSSENLNGVASASEEMSATISQIVQNTEKAMSITSDAVKQSKEVSVLMNDLGESANDIGKVTETITSISDQTNLLALNATIEAARAGAAGKGFAVVASEIKDLAKQTAEATEDIRIKIDRIQSSTKNSIADINKITEIVQQVNDYVTTIVAAVEEQAVTTKDITDNIGHASLAVQDATERSGQNSTVSQEIAREISEVSSSASAISDASTQVSTSAEDLSKLSEELTQIVNKFKV
jgi:methyl-accepting chemotaxis protein